MATTPKKIDWDAMPGRRCALCGKGQSPRKGGLFGFAAKIQIMKDAGIVMAYPEGRYLHHSCSQTQAPKESK